ncbi:MAG: thiamine phosphate synthase [Candidatus Dormibacteria bacterium]
MSPAWVGPPRSSVGLARSAQLHSARLYLVTSDETPAEQLPGLVAAAVDGGVDIIQLRRKQAPAVGLAKLGAACLAAARSRGALFLIDDHVDLAVEIDADGVHLGQTDLDPAEARERIGPDRLLGFSTHSSEQVRKAGELPLDYISAGPVHATPTKPGRPAVGFEHVRAASLRSRLPVVAIGGLGPDDAATAVEAGADLVAVVRAICDAADPGAAAAELRRAIEGARGWVRVGVNGEERRCPPGMSVQGYLELLEVGLDGVVVERNGEILGAEQLDRAPLQAGDQLEVVHLVGGGRDHGR